MKSTPPRPIQDEEGRALVARWRAGDKTAFADLFRMHRQLVLGVLRHLLPREPDLEDVVQTAFLEVFRSLDRFEGRSKLSSWVARVALHVGYHHLRHKRSRPQDYTAEPISVDTQDAAPDADPHEMVLRGEVMRHVHDVLSRLSPKKRTVFILAELEGLPHDEISEIVGASEATVRTRLFYARKDFWGHLEKDPLLSEYVARNAKATSPAGKETSR